MANANPFSVRYDARADVLYLNVSCEPAVRGVEDANGIVWRYGRDGSVIGATIVDFYECWLGRQTDLANEISRHFHVPTHLAASAVGRGLSSRGDAAC